MLYNVFVHEDGGFTTIGWHLCRSEAKRVARQFRAARPGSQVVVIEPASGKQRFAVI